MLMREKSNGWTKQEIISAIEARFGQKLSRRDITITADAKELSWAKTEAYFDCRGGVICVGGYGGTPDAVIYAEREPWDDAMPFINHIMFREGRISTMLIDDICDSLF